MDAKIFIFLMCALHYATCAGLLRTPKVYNALITTDDNLTPSRAFPLIQPTIHETGIASFPFGFHAYRYINQPPRPHFGLPGGENIFRNVPPHPYGAFPKGQFPLDPPQNQIPEAGPPLPAGNPTPTQLPAEFARPPLPLPNPQQNHQQPPIPPEAGRPPIPLNEFGLPPSLVPLPSYQRPQNPINLQPYPFNNYPLIFDSYNQFPEHYLPPFGYYPPPTGFGNVGIPNKGDKPVVQPNFPPMQKPEYPNAPEEVPNTPEQQDNSNNALPASDRDSLKVQPNVDGIKNVSANRNSEVPDVPPPPIPSGGKNSQ